MTAECVDERDFRLVELPARGQEATILVAVGVTEHHLLCATTALQEAQVLRHGEELVHDAAAVAQVGDGLEQRDNVHVELALARPQQSGLLEQQPDLEKVRDPVRLRDHVVGHRGLAITPVCLGCFAKDRQLRGRLRGISQERRRKQSRGLQLLAQEGDAGSFGEAGIVRVSAGHREQLADRALMHRGILPQIDAREMEAESVGCATQAAQPTARERRRAVGRERMIKNAEVGNELGSLGVRRRLTEGVARRLSLLERPRRRREARIDTGDSPTIRLAAALRRAIRRALRQVLELIGYGDQLRIER